jgi:uncharacterized protein YcfL
MQELRVSAWMRAAGLAGLVALAGCGTPVSTVEKKQPEARPNPVADRRVITDMGLWGRLKISEPITATDGGLLKVQLTLTNQTNSTSSYEYRFDWVDAQGKAIDSPTSRWTIVHIMARDSVAVSTVAPTPTATDFKFRLKRR